MELLEVQKEADSAGRKAIVFGIGALLLAGVFGWMLARLGGGGPEIQPVVVAAEDVAPLTVLTAKDLRIAMWPQTSIPVGTFSKPEDVIATEQVTLVGMVANEPVLKSRLASQDGGLGVSQLVEPSKRAYVVQVPEAIAKSQIINPGSYVDVLATIEDTKTRDLVSKVILQYVRVLAVGDSVDVEARPTNKDDVARNEDRTQVERRRVVTLLVNLNDVEYLAFAASQGRIDLALRSKADNEIVPTPGVNMEKVMGTRDKNNGPEIKAAPQGNDRSSKSSRSRGHSGGSNPTVYRVRH